MMKGIKFEYRITFAYLLIGGLWILFSDKVLKISVNDIELLSSLQTFKGWFYVLITAVLLFIFLKKHLNKLRVTEKELEEHESNLQLLVFEKTKNLDTAIEELSSTNEELYGKNNVINEQNSELKRMLQELKDTQAQLLLADKMAALGILTAGMAHEINNPLNYILGGLTGLEDYFPEEKRQNNNIPLYLNSIKAGIDRINLIVTGLNQLSRNNDSYNEECNIHEIIENCLTMMNNQLENRVQVNRIFSGEPIVLQGNIGQLHQVLLNVLLNASQAIEQEGSLTISTENIQNTLHLTVVDSGCGIDAANLSKITDPFFTTKEPGMGSGLGLSITYNLIKAHKGTIHFQSELNKGTKVLITLPIIKVNK